MFYKFICNLLYFMTPIKDKQRMKLSERAEEKGNTVI